MLAYYGTEISKHMTDTPEGYLICRDVPIARTGEMTYRAYVHLSADKDTAGKVGRRHGAPVVYTVQAGKMSADGYLFYRSVNGVWLTKEVPTEYLAKQ